MHEISLKSLNLLIFRYVAGWHTYWSRPVWMWNRSADLA